MSDSVINFVKGIIRLQISKEGNEEINQKVQADNVAFAVRGTDYEVSLEGDDVDLDVHEGAVEVTSPDVHTFVPEIVKAGKGFRFDRKQKKFANRAFGPRFKNHPGFINKKELRARWIKDKVARKALRDQKRVERSEKKNERQAARMQRKTERAQRKNR